MLLCVAISWKSSVNRALSLLTGEHKMLRLCHHFSRLCFRIKMSNNNIYYRIIHFSLDDIMYFMTMNNERCVCFIKLATIFPRENLFVQHFSRCVFFSLHSIRVTKTFNQLTMDGVCSLAKSNTRNYVPRLWSIECH